MLVLILASSDAALKFSPVSSLQDMCKIACMACQVAELSGRVSALQMSLQLSAMREFELLGTGEDKPNPLLLERLRACCLVIDVLGFKVRFKDHMDTEEFQEIALSILHRLQMPLGVSTLLVQQL